MRLLTIDLENIRSYRKQKVEFMDGISLFEGDIGSGKSSILNAIEFALFGLGDLKGSHLLRVGENEGRVELELEINGRLYVFGRTLRKKGSGVSQDACYIIEDDIKTSYSITNMKKRVLQLLDFKESSNPRSHSVIYRFAVFTPQEAMKEVLGQKPKDRKQTLRKAFGIEEYNIAAENTSTLVSDINVDMRVLKQSEEEIGTITKTIDDEKTQIETLETENESNSSQIHKLQEEKTSTETLLESKRKEVEKYTQINSQLEIQTSSKNLQTRSLLQERERSIGIKQKLDESIEAEKTTKILEPDYSDLLSSREKRRKLEPKKEAHTLAEANSKLVVQRIESEKERIEEKIEGNTKQQSEFAQEVEGIRGELENLPGLRGKKTDLSKELEALPLLREKDNGYTGQISEKKQNLRTTQETGGRLVEEWSEIESIGLGAQCPRCHQTLSEKHYQLLEQKYKQETLDSEKEAEQISELLKELAKEQADNKAYIQQLEAKEKNLRETEAEILSLENKQDSIEGILKKIKALKQENIELKTSLENENYAQESRTKLSESLETIDQNQEAAAEYDQLKKVIDGYEASDTERKYLESKAFADRKHEFTTQHNESLEAISKIKGNLDTIKEQIKVLTKDLEHYDNPEQERDTLQNKASELGEQIAGLYALVKANNARIAEAETRIEGHETNLQRHRRNIDQSQEYGLIRRWLEEAFIPSIHSIEQNVLRRLHNEFNRLFVKWFKTLLESEDIEGYIDEDFTPIIDQSGYELDLASLSGGEKTSVALAYRLALNTIVKQVTDTMRNNLLILDEPTDGFSREQLAKMREILHDLNCEQVIMVSHEQELESVADHVYKVHKQGTVSSVIHP